MWKGRTGAVGGSIVTGPRPQGSQSIDQDGLPIPGSHSVGSSSLLGEPDGGDTQRSHCPISNTPCEPRHVSIPRRFSQPDD